MKFSIGDKVKFMDQEGQGEVTRIINSSTVGVTCDGFEIPYANTDLIKVEKPATIAEQLFYEGKGSYDNPDKNPGKESSKNRFLLKNQQESKNRRNQADMATNAYGYSQADLSVISHMDSPSATTPSQEGTISENTGTDERITPLKRGFVSKRPQPEGIYLAMVPLDQEFMLRGPVELYVINYTPHTLLYNLATRGGESFYGVDFASVPPYSKILVESIEREDLGLWSEGVLQCLFFQDEAQSWLLPSSHEYKIKGNRLGQSESYVHPVFMQEKAMLIPMVNLPGHQANNALLHQSLLAEKLSEAQQESIHIQVESTPSRPKFQINSKDPMARYMISKDVAEVDLHIEAIQESRPELRNIREEEYLGKQLMIFEDTLDKAISRRLEKIIFIHGVGNGILKSEIEKRLRNYPHLHFMNASILKYGRGAIEVYLDTQK